MLAAGIPPPPLKAAHVGDVRGDALLEELDQPLIVEQNVAAATALFELLELAAHARVLA